jgi:CubicO group peptidase (beta-lactamase class C family)
LELDALFWMGSCTKLMTSIAALQCVERGYFTLDEDVTRLLPELKDIEVQTSKKNETGAPVRVKARKTITLR